MKLLGGTDDGGGRGPPARSQDDAAVGYVFQRHSHEPEFHQFKQPRWASGDDAIIDMGFAVIPVSLTFALPFPSTVTYRFPMFSLSRELISQL